MKINKQQLKRIIKEELKRMLKESNWMDAPGPGGAALHQQRRAKANEPYFDKNEQDRILAEKGLEIGDLEQTIYAMQYPNDLPAGLTPREFKKFYKPERDPRSGMTDWYLTPGK